MSQKLIKLLFLLPLLWGISWVNLSLAAPKIETAGEEGKISKESFLSLAKDTPNEVHWIDTRDPSEVNVDGTLAGAKVMNIKDLKKKIAELPADKPIIFFCSTGARAGEAYDLVKLKRPSLVVYFLDASAEFRKQPIPVLSPPK